MNRFWIAGGTLLALASTPAIAQRIDHVGPERGFYVGAGVGQFSGEIDSIGDVDINFDADDDAFKFFGGWRFNPYVSAELAWIDFGSPATATELFDVSSDAKGIAPYVIGTVPLGMVELFAKAGWLFYDVDVDVGTDLDDFGVDDSGNDFTWGAGIGVTVLERLHLRGEYERVDVGDFDRADAVWLNASWRF